MQFYNACYAPENWQRDRKVFIDLLDKESTELPYKTRIENVLANHPELKEFSELYFYVKDKNFLMSKKQLSGYFL